MLVRVLVVLAVVAVAIGLGAWWRSRQGVVRTTAAAPSFPDVSAALWRDRGVELGGTATFVQFSTDHCSPCRATARVLGTLVTGRHDVSHREMDIDQNLDLVRRFSVLRAPTVLVLDRDGREVARMSGAVNRAQAERALEVASGG